MKNTFFEIDLQLFAMIEGQINGTVSEGSTGSGTVELSATGNTNTDLTPEMRIFYDKALIELTGPKLIHSQFAQKKPIPQNGGKTIQFRQFKPLPKATTPITEGVTPQGNKLEATAMEATVEQYGDYIEHSDMLELTAVDPAINTSVKLLSDQAGRTLDTITRDVLATNPHVIYASKVGAGGTETPVSSRSTLDATAKIKVKDIQKAVAFLRGNNAPTIDGTNYAAFIHPYAEFDLMNDPRWENIQDYATPENRLKGEIGRIAGCRFVESTEAKIWNSEDDNCPEGVAVFGTTIVGSEAYGETEITGGGLQTIVKQVGSSGSSDPMNQRGSVAWKATHVAEILVDIYMVRIESAVDADFTVPEGGN